MIRVKNNETSLSFYQEIMGMKLLRTSENASNGFNLYFLGYPDNLDMSEDSANGVNLTADKEGILVRNWLQRLPQFVSESSNWRPN